MKLDHWVLLGFLSSLCGAAEIPAPVLPAGTGVNIHFVTGHQRDLDRIAEAGFKFIRMDFGWASSETRKGEYQWGDYDELIANLERRGLRAVLILDYSNPLYEPTVTSLNPLTHQSHQTTASPQHSESVSAYAKWAAAAARHFRGRHVLWELWNEPNIDFWSPKPDAQQYTAMALAAARAIRDAEPSSTIIGPASSGFPWEFLETFFKSGVLNYLDAVSVHPYRGPDKAPETAAGDYQKLRELIKRYAPSTRPAEIPILSGEWGYSSWNRGVSVETQAAFAARQQMANLLNGVPLSIWYDWKNDGTDPNENEHNFGTVLPDLTPKPAYLAIQTLTRELAGYHVSKRLTLASDKDYAILFENVSKQQKIAAWTLGDSHPVSVDLPSKDVKSATGKTGSGDSFKPKIDSGRLSVDLIGLPQYVTLVD